MDAFIYGIRNLVNNKIYIGSTKNIKYRKYFHFYDLKHKRHHSTHLQKSFDKYGKEQFVFFCIEVCTKLNRKEREIHHITINQAYDRNFGYNTDEPSTNNFQRSKETKQKISKSKYHSDKAVAIDVYDLTGSFISSHSSINDCAREIGMNSSTINQILQGSRKSHKGKTFVIGGEPYTYIQSNKQRNMKKYYK